MKKVFKTVGDLDKNCYDKYKLTEDILMEHAGASIFNYIKKKFKKNKNILIVCGAGNNGADGLVLARLLFGSFNIYLYLSDMMKNQIGKTQENRAKAVGVEIYDQLPSTKDFDIVVDCLFGSGLSRALDEKYINIINFINDTKAYTIACDIPSGLDNTGLPSPVCVDANVTITMGGLKLCLYADISKDYVGKVVVANLGVDRKIYEKNTNYYLLEKKDISLPYRTKSNTNKSNFGHLAVVCGDKQGAAKLSANSAICFACGLVTVISSKFVSNLSDNIMQTNSLPATATAMAIGMGLGINYDATLLKNSLPKIIDADMFYDKNIIKLLRSDNIVLTPHPKEFSSLLNLSNLGNIDVKTIQENRFKYVKLFNDKYPNIVLLLKGANHIIAYKQNFYINSFGTSVLSTAGSGDVLSGLIGSSLAYGLSPLEATILGSLTHTLLSNKFKKGSYSVTANSLIEKIKTV